MELPQRKHNRLSEYDYRTANAYFITICTDGRRNLFWTEENAIIDQPANVPLTQLGRLVQQTIERIPDHYPAITVDHFVIMPNHIHLLLQIHSVNHGQSMTIPTISTVVQQLKGAVSKQAGFPIWQKGFHDHVVRNDTDYQNIWNYIEGNPGKWEDDQLRKTGK